MAQSILENRVREQIFADPQQENYVCTAGTKNLNRFLDTGRLNKAFAVLSDCSVYCKGRFTVQKNGAPAAKRLAEYRVDIPEISSVKHIRAWRYWLLGLSIFFLLLAALMPFAVPLLQKLARPRLVTLTPAIDAIVCGLLGLVFLLLFFLHRTTLLQISYSRGKIRLNANKLPPAEERVFVKKLRALLAAWDEYVEQERYHDAYAQVFDQAYDQAYSQGYRSGYSQAYAPGYVQGYQSGYSQAAPAADASAQPQENPPAPFWPEDPAAPAPYQPPEGPQGY